MNNKKETYATDLVRKKIYMLLLYCANNYNSVTIKQNMYNFWIGTADSENEDWLLTWNFTSCKLVFPSRNTRRRKGAWIGEMSRISLFCRSITRNEDILANVSSSIKEIRLSLKSSTSSSSRPCAHEIEILLPQIQNRYCKGLAICHACKVYHVSLHHDYHFYFCLQNPQQYHISITLEQCEWILFWHNRQRRFISSKSSIGHEFIL